MSSMPQHAVIATETMEQRSGLISGFFNPLWTNTMITWHDQVHCSVCDTWMATPD